MRYLLYISFLILTFSTEAQTSNGTKGQVNMVGPYKLGTSFDELKDRTGFKYDSSRSKPEKRILAGKIIDVKVFEQATIQRLIFHNNKLVRVSIIIGNQEFTEDQTKALVAEQWGDPGEKQKFGGVTTYIWTGTSGTIMLLPADGGRQMITLTDNDKTHYVE